MAFIAPDETLVAFHNYCYVFRKRIAVFFTIYNIIVLHGGHRGVVSLVQSSPYWIFARKQEKTLIRRIFLYCLIVNEE